MSIRAAFCNIAQSTRNPLINVAAAGTLLEPGSHNQTVPNLCSHTTVLGRNQGSIGRGSNALLDGAQYGEQQAMKLEQIFLVITS